MRLRFRSPKTLAKPDASMGIKWSLSITMVRNLLLGLILVAFPSQFVSPIYQEVFDIIPPTWVATMLLAGSIGGMASWYWRNTLWARISVLLCDVVFLSLIASYFALLVNGGQLSGHWAPVLFGSMVAKDFVLISMPFVDQTRHFEPKVWLQEENRPDVH